MSKLDQLAWRRRRRIQLRESRWGLRWLPAEDLILRLLVTERYSGYAIAMVLRRSVAGVYARLRALEMGRMGHFRNDYAAADKAVERSQQAAVRTFRKELSRNKYAS